MDSAARPTRWLVRLAWTAFVLAAIVVAASSYLRLAGNGLDCTPWPACYGSATALSEANASAGTQAARLAHRAAATTFLVVAIAVVWLGWPRWARDQRIQGLLLVGVALALAAIGRLTPSQLPWITWANVLGGFSLIGLALALAWPRAAPTPAQPANVASVALVILLGAIVLGGTLLSVRLAASACQPACAAAPGGDLVALLRPDQPGDVATVAQHPGGATLLHGLHRVGGIVLVLVAVGVALRARRGTHRAAAIVAAAALLSLGFMQTHLAGPVLGATHALAAAFLIALMALRDRGAVK